MVGMSLQGSVPLLTERRAKDSNYSELRQILPHDSGDPVQRSSHADYSDAAFTVDF